MKKVKLPLKPEPERDIEYVYGRPRSKVQREENLAELPTKVALRGVTPIEVMVNAMREYDAEAEEAFNLSIDERDPDRKEELRSYGRQMMQMASDTAKDAAPYIHSKLNSTTLLGNPDQPLGMALVSAAELKKFVRGK